jgi:hypothetical protein
MVRLDLNGLCPSVCPLRYTTAIIYPVYSVNIDPGNGREEETVEIHNERAPEANKRTLSQVGAYAEQRR